MCMKYDSSTLDNITLLTSELKEIMKDVDTGGKQKTSSVKQNKEACEPFPDYIPLIRYIRVPSQQWESRGDPIGVLISSKKGYIGMSLCNPTDRFTKWMGKFIAKSNELPIEYFVDNFYSDLPFDQPRRANVLNTFCAFMKDYITYWK